MNKVAGKVRAETKVIYDLYAALSEDGAAFCVKKDPVRCTGSDSSLM